MEVYHAGMVWKLTKHEKTHITPPTHTLFVDPPFVCRVHRWRPLLTWARSGRNGMELPAHRKPKLCGVFAGDLSLSCGGMKKVRRRENETRRED